MLYLGKYVYFTLALLIGALVVYKSLDYLSPDFTSGFLSDKQEVFPAYAPFLYMHILGAPLALLAGLYQFTFPKRAGHKTVGKVYLYSIVLLAAPGGFGMAFFALGGMWSVINFLLLSSLWFGFTIIAYRQIKKGDPLQHRQFMIRSFILTNSAVLIRLFSFINNSFQITDVMTGYVIISWLSWVPFWLGYELVLGMSTTPSSYIKKEWVKGDKK